MLHNFFSQQFCKLLHTVHYQRQVSSIYWCHVVYYRAAGLQAGPLVAALTVIAIFSSFFPFCFFSSLADFLPLLLSDGGAYSTPVRFLYSAFAARRLLTSCWISSRMQNEAEFCNKLQILQKPSNNYPPSTKNLQTVPNMQITEYNLRIERQAENHSVANNYINTYVCVKSENFLFPN